jgi:two-component system, LuxR family, response regulator FixJ
MPGLALFDVRPGEGIGCRLAGAAFKFRFGYDITGGDWLAMTPPGQRGVRIERNSAIVQGALSSGQRSDPDREGPDRWFEDIQLPFADMDESGARTYLHHSEWRPQGEERRLGRPRKGGPAIAERFRAISIVDGGTAVQRHDPAPSCLARVDDSPRAEPLVPVLSRFAAREPQPEALPLFNGETAFVGIDNCAFWEALTLLLEASGLKTIGFGSVEEVVRRPAAGPCVCVVSLVDIPTILDREAETNLSLLCRQHRVIVLASQGDIRSAVRAMMLGAVEVVEVPFRTDQLLGSIRHALAGRSDVEIFSALRSRAAVAQLSSREREIFQLLASGMTSKSISTELDISARTVEVHRANIMRKLRLGSIADLVRLAHAGT